MFLKYTNYISKMKLKVYQHLHLPAEVELFRDLSSLTAGGLGLLLRSFLFRSDSEIDKNKHLVNYLIKLIKKKIIIVVCFTFWGMG